MPRDRAELRRVKALRGVLEEKYAAGSKRRHRHARESRAGDGKAGNWCRETGGTVGRAGGRKGWVHVRTLEKWDFQGEAQQPPQFMN